MMHDGRKTHSSSLPQEETHDPAGPPTRECLFQRLPAIDNYLQRMGFKEAVAIPAALRAIGIGLHYLNDGRAVHLHNRVKWLYRVAYRAALRIRRKELGYFLLGDRDIAESKPGVDPPSADVLQAAACLARLTSPQRRAVTFHIMRGLSLRQAAKVMGVSVATFRVHLKRGLKRLREEMPISGAIQSRAPDSK